MSENNHDSNFNSDAGVDLGDDHTVYDQLQTVEQLAEQFMQSIRDGKNPSIDSYIALHPRLASQIRDLFPTVLMMEQARGQSMTHRRDGRVAKGPQQIKQLGDFEIIREIGRGGMGIVYEAEQQSLGRRVAVKVLPNSSLTESQLKQFERESHLAANLHHTNIVPVYGVGQQDGLNYYVMQLIGGESLARYVETGEYSGTEEGDQSKGDQSKGDQSKGDPSEEEADEDSSSGNRENRDLAIGGHATSPKSLSVREVCNVGRQVASALDYAHDSKTLHRDIKPSNLILDERQNVWITDFGLAIRNNEGPATTSGELSVPGTLRYLPPEKLAGMPDAPQSDVYALGVSLIELLSGKPAFTFTDQNDLIEKIRFGQLEEITDHGKAVPPDVESVLRKAVASDIDQRYQTAGQLADDLENVLEKRPVSCYRSSNLDRVKSWLENNPALAMMTAACALLLMIVSLVSTIGYVRVQSALTSEQAQHERAEDASRLASGSLEKIFGRFSPDSQFTESGHELNLTQPVLSDEVVFMLQDLLVFYKQLASTSSDDPVLAYRTSLARCRVGEINERLGHYEVAAASYGSALADFNRLHNRDKYVVQIARIHNQLGFVTRMMGHREEAIDHHKDAIAELTMPRPISSAAREEIQLELARSHYYMGHIVRPGFGPTSLPPIFFGMRSSEDVSETDRNVPTLSSFNRQELEEAISILKAIDPHSESVGAAKSHLLALCYREQADDQWQRRSEQDIEADNQAIELLEQLSNDFPQETVYKFDLMQTLSQINVFEPNMGASTLTQAYTSLEQALDIGDSLIENRPDVASFRAAFIHTNFKMAVVAERLAKLTEDETENQELLDESEKRYRRAVAGQSYLMRRYPNADGYVVWHARFSLSLTKSPNMSNQTRYRERLIGRVMANLMKLPTELKQTPEVQALIREGDPLSRQ